MSRDARMSFALSMSLCTMLGYIATFDTNARMALITICGNGVGGYLALMTPDRKKTEKENASSQ